MGINTHWISGGGLFRMCHSVEQLQRDDRGTADSVNADKGQDAGSVDICFTKISGEPFLGQMT